ncbi:MAG: hypothetical protein IPK64_00905 [bacterium]|nr:hypothetical protein [bacterium]
MRIAWPAVVLPILAALLSACGEGFPDQEMHLGLEDKVRPYAITLEPPEAAPGDTVRVTLLARVPRPDEVDIGWKVALDYDSGLYGVDDVERNQRPLAAGEPEVDQDGFLSQSFLWVVPDSALLYSSALPAVVDDPALVAIAAQLPGLGSGPTWRKDEIDAWLKGVSREDLAAMDAFTRAAVWGLADRFACAVRFRATLRTNVVVDVTRNLTIRHTRRLDGPNTNHNTFVVSFEVVAVARRDASPADIDDPDVPQTRQVFVDSWGQRVADRIELPVDPGWTYFARGDFAAESYTSPWDPGLVIDELALFRWYYYRQDAPGVEHALFVTDEGEDAEMWNLNDVIRLEPDGPGSTFRLLLVVRDSRREWDSFQGTPGTGVAEGVVAFVEP